MCFRAKTHVDRLYTGRRPTYHQKTADSYSALSARRNFWCSTVHFNTATFATSKRSMGEVKPETPFLKLNKTIKKMNSHLSPKTPIK